MYLAHLEKLLRTRLCDVLVEEGVLERSRVEEAQADQDDTGKQLGEILVEQEVLTDYDLAKIVTEHYALPYLDLAGYSMRREMMEVLPLDFCAKNALLPIDQFGSMLTLAVAEMPSSEVIDEIVKTTQLTPILFVATRRGMLSLIEEERKRGAGRPAKPAAKAPAATATTAAPTPAAQPITGPVAASGQAEELPEFDLPMVPLKLAGSMARNKPGAAPAAKPPVAGNKKTPAAALRWMDAAAKSDTAKPAAEAPKPNVSKYGGAAAVAPRPATPAAAAAPAAKPAAVPGKPASDASWQAMFDVADEAVKKVKPK